MPAAGAGAGGLASGGAALGVRLRGPALAPALEAGGTVLGVSSATAGFLAAARFLVHGRPGAAGGLFAPDAALLVTFFDVLGATFLLRRIARFISAWHGWLLSRIRGR